ncbi:hypothetical protein BO78DRAFT_153041 [Aspergillus sclerotiicarbonarius CBS 121057]|uniref:Uncharacterized protein n=1 Tax=Aspergillus sclerotiicarbonarius (strain CBS 121057 / IBT 28362) TaxID=1448318 RepID=A0A319E5M8_ASPSB|nr:hypothetical protein BO78DRAFT_153041 [Aspergillus sclerotiicarbonarius CBS 121057]
MAGADVVIVRHTLLGEYQPLPTNSKKIVPNHFQQYVCGSTACHQTGLYISHFHRDSRFSQHFLSFFITACIRALDKGCYTGTPIFFVAMHLIRRLLSPPFCLCNLTEHQSVYRITYTDNHHQFIPKASFKITARHARVRLILSPYLLDPYASPWPHGLMGKLYSLYS